ncbi:hypothetical protein PIB30_067392 [Stylosanthes scabra]|uniref:Uncharacterized protein n=1 Tax=Stylosanthes scabra TaxID=79078 RepID=A0ABU6YPF3_9FABA|nr:hypothetical protein [Stylosanthes scabra]
MQIMKTTMIVSLLVTLTVSYVVHVLCDDRKAEGLYVAAPWLLARAAVAAAVAWVMVLALRATMVTWVTVLVLLSFAGNRRKILVQQGRRITVDVALNLISIVFRSQKGLFALACTTITMVCLLA